MPSKFESRLGDLQKRLDRGQRAGLIAAGYVLRNEVVKRLMRGYTSGQFVDKWTGVHKSVTVSDVFITPAGLGIAVGTDVIYALFWEIGHRNLFTGKFERVEHWRLSMLDRRREIQDAFSRASKRELTGK